MYKLKFNKTWENMDDDEKMTVAGFFEEARTDENSDIRLNYFRANGFDISAKTDGDYYIREQAEKFFRLTNNIQCITIDGIEYKRVEASDV